MKKVCVITGGGSGMGLATAKLICEEGYYTILVGRTASKLEKAVNDLRSAGGEAEAFSCDVSDRESCFALAKHAAECGEVKAVLHIAGLSPHMDDAEKILCGNALGTVNINFDTPMGALESGQADVFKKYSALKRNGKPEEIAALFALLLDERLGFLTGADILMDGGVVASGASGLSK